ncbi:helix-turn-helix domain-containing protein [Streptomyces sp. NPDC059928]|uniref:helix-turn-helix domain-containing protein n=1 Tax=unclassified Streptomyces TaxID=2593676 RepID=UPI0036503B60
MPYTDLGPPVGDRLVTASAGSAEMRLLLAHADLLGQTFTDLTATGAQAARQALIELARGVLRQHLDGAEPQLAPALARAAQNLAAVHLADPDLSPSLLARELKVSVRTLHRAFGPVQETAGGYILRRRLEQARRELATPGRVSVSELAARWQFADSSHFIRAFKHRYGQTPTAPAARRSGAAATATRPVPIPPQFVRTLLAHIKRLGVAPDGRVFRNQAGNYVEAAAYGTTWARARKYVLTRTELASGLAKRPYGLRHAGISFWLYSGVDPAECARRAGQRVEVLFRMPSSLTVYGSRPTASSSSPCGSGTASTRARRLRGEPGFGP